MTISQAQANNNFDCFIVEAQEQLRYGGDSSKVQEQLQHVEQVQASHYGFAAVCKGGTVVTWGSPACGTNGTIDQQQLTQVQQIRATDIAFAAVLEDGSIVTWGDSVFLVRSDGNFKPRELIEIIVITL